MLEDSKETVRMDTNDRTNILATESSHSRVYNVRSESTVGDRIEEGKLRRRVQYLLSKRRNCAKSRFEASETYTEP
jgi:hypothetical protein